MTEKLQKGLYITLSIVIIIILVALFGGPILNEINAYRENIMQQSEEECAQEDAPFWCNL